MSAGSLYCPKCATPVAHGIPACPSCGVPFVQQVAAQPVYQEQQVYQQQPVYPQQPSAHLSEANNKKMSAGLCAILLGGLGIHKFILGYNTAGWVYVGILIGSILLTCLTVGIIPIVVLTGPIMGIISLIEGIMYLTKTDEDFYYTYIANRREWF
jgi:TM2 domain-containing membrane protein YozV